MNDLTPDKQMFQFSIDFLNIKLYKLILGDKELSYQFSLTIIIKVFLKDNSLEIIHTFWNNPLG